MTIEIINETEKYKASSYKEAEIFLLNNMKPIEKAIVNQNGKKRKYFYHIVKNKLVLNYKII
jgi:hypothetical protein